jgi:hypothetical protein
MNYEKLIRNFKELNVTEVTEVRYDEVATFPLWIDFMKDKVRHICKLGIDRKADLEFPWQFIYVLNSDLNYLVSLSSLERLEIAESILEEL